MAGADPNENLDRIAFSISVIGAGDYLSAHTARVGLGKRVS